MYSPKKMCTFELNASIWCSVRSKLEARRVMFFCKQFSHVGFICMECMNVKSPPNALCYNFIYKILHLLWLG